MDAGVEEIDISAIRPSGGLVDSSDCLADRQRLAARYDEDGYLFFRGAVPRAAAEAARLKMARVLADQGLVESTAADARWTGGERPHLLEEDPHFAGICTALFAVPAVRGMFERMLGERVEMVPNVLYRAYKPGNRPGPVHQDGPFNPGCEGYRSLWIALTDIDEAMGGLVLAPGCHRDGTLHQGEFGGKIPKSAVPDDAWRREHYRQGDVVMLHGMTPHGGMPNRSSRIRYSLDTRVQSAANPTVFQGVLTAAGADRIAMTRDTGEELELALDEASLLRFGYSGTPLPPDEFLALNPVGMRVMVTRKGDTALMVRHASAG